MSFGNDGWRRVPGADLDLPGAVYVRVQAVEGVLRVTELYIDGGGQPIQSGAVRRLPLTALELLAGTDEPNGVPGPDLSLLASNFGLSLGDLLWDGGECPRCPSCDGVVKPDPPWIEDEFLTEGRKHWSITDWVVLSLLSQYPRANVSRPRRGRADRVRPAETEVKIAPPEEGLTDAFLLDVARNWQAAVNDRRAPAKAIAESAGVSPRTVQGWVRKARQRGLMPPATKRGRIA